MSAPEAAVAMRNPRLILAQVYDNADEISLVKRAVFDQFMGPRFLATNPDDERYFRYAAAVVRRKAIHLRCSHQLDPATANRLFKCRPYGGTFFLRPQERGRKPILLKWTCDLRICPHCRARKIAEHLKLLTADPSPFLKCCRSDLIGPRDDVPQMRERFGILRRTAGRVLRNYGAKRTLVTAYAEPWPAGGWRYFLAAIVPMASQTELPETVKLIRAHRFDTQFSSKTFAASPATRLKCLEKAMGMPTWIWRPENSALLGGYLNATKSLAEISFVGTS